MIVGQCLLSLQEGVGLTILGHGSSLCKRAEIGRVRCTTFLIFPLFEKANFWPTVTLTVFFFFHRKQERCRGAPTLSDVIYINMWSWLSANLLHSFASWRIFEQQKLLTWRVHSGWGVFSTLLKLSIRLRSITAIHLALKSHMNVVWWSKRHAMLPSDWCDTFNIPNLP